MNATKRNEDQKELSPRAWDALLQLLPTFEQPGYSFGRIEAIPDQIAHPALSREVWAFLDALHKHGWLTPFDWSEWQSEAEQLVSDPARLARADLATLRKLLTLHVRKDRFCDGHLLGMFETGHMTQILQRLKALHDAQAPGRLRFHRTSVVDVPLAVLENVHWRPQAAKLGPLFKKSLDAATSPAHQRKRTIDKLRLTWAREETWTNHALNALLAALPESLLGSVLSDLLSSQGFSRPQTHRLDYGNIRGVTGDPDFILRDETHCVLGESKVRAHSKSARYTFEQFTKYMQLAAISTCASDPRLRRTTSHVIVVPDTNPSAFCSDAPEWSPSLVAGNRLAADPAVLGGGPKRGSKASGFAAWLHGVRDTLLSERVRRACELDEALVNRLLKCDSPVLIPTYVVTWDDLMTRIEQSCMSQGLDSLARASTSLRSMAYGGSVWAEGSPA